MCVCVCVWVHTNWSCSLVHAQEQPDLWRSHSLHQFAGESHESLAPFLQSLLHWTLSHSLISWSSFLHTSQKPSTTTCGYTSIIPIHIESDCRCRTYKHHLEQGVAAEALRPNQSREKSYHFCSEKMACCCSWSSSSCGSNFKPPENQLQSTKCRSCIWDWWHLIMQMMIAEAAAAQPLAMKNIHCIILLWAFYLKEDFFLS